MSVWAYMCSSDPQLVFCNEQIIVPPFPHGWLGGGAENERLLHGALHPWGLSRQHSFEVVEARKKWGSFWEVGAGQVKQAL